MSEKFLHARKILVELLSKILCAENCFVLITMSLEWDKDLDGKEEKGNEEKEEEEKEERVLRCARKKVGGLKGLR